MGSRREIAVHGCCRIEYRLLQISPETLDPAVLAFGGCSCRHGIFNGESTLLEVRQKSVCLRPWLQQAVMYEAMRCDLKRPSYHASEGLPKTRNDYRRIVSPGARLCGPMRTSELLENVMFKRALAFFLELHDVYYARHEMVHLLHSTIEYLHT